MEILADQVMDLLRIQLSTITEQNQVIQNLREANHQLTQALLSQSLISGQEPEEIEDEILSYSDFETIVLGDIDDNDAA